MSDFEKSLADVLAHLSRKLEQAADWCEEQARNQQLGQRVQMNGSQQESSKPFAERWAEHPIWDKIDSFLKEMEGLTPEQRKARDDASMRAAMDNELIRMMRGHGASIFEEPKQGTLEGPLSREEIAHLTDKELLALHAKMDSELCSIDGIVTASLVREWAYEISGRQLGERLQQEREWREEMEKDRGSDWFDWHLGNRDG